MTSTDFAPSTGTLDTSPSARQGRVRNAVLGAAASFLSIAASMVAAFAAWDGPISLPAIAAFAFGIAVFVSRGVADAGGARAPLTVGLLVQGAALAGVLLLPGAAALWLVLDGLGLGIVLPAALGSLIGSPAAGVPTPRVLLPRRFEVPVAARAEHRASALLAVLGGGGLAIGWALGRPFGVVIALLGAVGVGVSVLRSRRGADPLAPSETAGALLVPMAAALAIGILSADLIKLALPGWGVPAAVLGVVAVAAVVSRGGRAAASSLVTAGTRYRAATSAYDSSARLAPRMATVARSADDVRAAVLQARRAGLGVRAHSTGHSAGTSAPFEHDALIKVLVDEPVSVDVAARTVRIPAGARWGDVVRAVTPFGLGAPHGSSSQVGAIGYLLRGGLSPYGRTTGVAANSVSSIEIVLADGELVVSDREHHAELFWALRGGGGGFGIVTAITVRLFDLTAVVTGTALWPAEHAPALAEAWHEWTTEAPERITTTFRVMRFPALPGLPRLMSSGPLAVVDGTAIAARPADVPAAEAAALDLLGRLRRIADPLLDSWKTASAYETPNTHMDPPIGLAHTGDSFMLDDPTGTGVASFVDAARAAGLASFELRQLGGALARRPDDGGAVAHLPADFSYWGVGLHSRTMAEASVRERLASVRSTLGPWNADLVVPTFAPDASLPQRPFDDATRSRVRAARHQVDPDGLFARDIAPGAS